MSLFWAILSFTNQRNRTQIKVLHLNRYTGFRLLLRYSSLAIFNNFSGFTFILMQLP